MLTKKLCALSFCLIILFLLGSCASISWPRAYNDAIRDAINPEPDEIVYNLTSIVQSNAELAWRDFDGIPHVLMVSLVRNTSYYENSVGKQYNTKEYYTWITAVPEIRKICSQQGFAGDDLTMRLRQLLGLPPNSKNVAFVEFWVNPKDVFRPSPDNEIVDTTAGLNLAANTEPWYRKWFNELRANQYCQSENPKQDAYPWTQLGYTYDWGNSDSEQGVSEFVIKKGAEVIVNAIYLIDAYCNDTNEVIPTKVRKVP